MQVKMGVVLAMIIGLILLGMAYGGLTKQKENNLSDSNVSPTMSTDSNEPEVVADNLEIPWEMVLLDNNIMLVTEREGRLVKIENGKKTVIAEFKDIYKEGEAGLLGLAVHPDFFENRWIYVYMTVSGNNRVENEVRRYVYREDRLSSEEIIVSGIEGAIIHNGGRIKFGPDGYLYITTGDANITRLAQDLNSLAGKILRVGDDGAIASDNPFENEIYSFGHRNPQGIAWDSLDRLWATEHGPSANDEINMIVAGGNYGWPEIRGDETREGMINPVISSGPNETWAPSGMEIVDDWIYFVGLRGQNLYRMKAQSERVELEKMLDGVYGRMRFVNAFADGYFYIGTNNRDGRGQPRTNDDKIIKIALE